LEDNFDLRADTVIVSEVTVFGISNYGNSN